MQSKVYAIPIQSGGVPAYMSRPEAAEYCRVSLAFLAEKTATGEIRSLKVGDRRIYRRFDLDTWMSSKLVTVPAHRGRLRPQGSEKDDDCTAGAELDSQVESSGVVTLHRDG